VNDVHTDCVRMKYLVHYVQVNLIRPGNDNRITRPMCIGKRHASVMELGHEPLDYTLYVLCTHCYESHSFPIARRTRMPKEMRAQGLLTLTGVLNNLPLRSQAPVGSATNTYAPVCVSARYYRLR
jgi:hypothetical protein